jgi:hypoxanthine phosphoribosyltransferase
MKSLRFGEKKFKLYIEQKQIIEAVEKVAASLAADFGNKDVVFIAVLNGSFMYASELLQRFPFPCQVSFVKMASYTGVQSSGQITELIGLNQEVTGKHVVIIEDIVDSGNTLIHMQQLLLEQSPASVTTTCLLFKPAAFKYQHTPEYIGIEVPNLFLIGFGLDYDGFGRNYPNIYTLES